MKRIILLLAFSGLLVLPECNPCRCPTVSDVFFDIQDMAIGHVENGMSYIDLSSPMSPSEYSGVTLSFEVEYVAALAPFHLFQSNAMACSCPEPGFAGSKHEAFTNIVLTTVHDFNQNIRAGDTITSFFSVDWNLDTMSIPAFIQADTGNIDYERYTFLLNEFPQNDSNGFEVEAHVELSTGEIYSKRSGAVFFK